MVAILIALLLVLYKTMFMPTPIEEPVEDLAKESKIEQTFAKLESMNFDLSAINDPKFMSLESLERPLVQTTVGRKNPFAVILGSQPK